jgi:hypothetical protein
MSQQQHVKIPGSNPKMLSYMCTLHTKFGVVEPTTITYGNIPRLTQKHSTVVFHFPNFLFLPRFSTNLGGPTAVSSF